MKRLLTIICVAFSMFTAVYAQPFKVTGVVTSADDGLPLPGVNVVLSGTGKGVTTNLYGKYTIDVPDRKAQLEFSFVGFVTQKITVNNKAEINIILNNSIKAIDEVVVVGYGAQKKETMVGAIATTNSTEVRKANTDNIGAALVGRLSGLTGWQQSSQPGSARPELKLRGRTDILVIVDGVETSGGRRLPSASESDSWNTTGSISGWETINPNDIESISMLKDASATAVYGVRGANGVLIITTKRGRSGAPVVSYSQSTSLSTPLSQIKTAGSYDVLGILNQANAVDGAGLFLFNYDNWQRFRYPTGPNDAILYPSLDAVSAYTKEYSPKTDHSLSLRGGDDFVKYYASIGYYDEKGMMKEMPNLSPDYNFGYKRFSFRSNLDFNLTKRLTVNVSLDNRFENRTGPAMGGADTHFDWVYYARPWITPGIVDDKFVKNIIPNDNSKYSLQEYYLSGGFYAYDQVTSVNRLSAQYDLDFITKGLSAKATYALDSYTVSGATRSRNYAVWEPREDPATNELYFMRAIDRYGNKVEDGPYNKVASTTGRNRKDYFESSLNYARTFFEKHSVTALALYNYEKNYYQYDGGYRDIPRTYLGFVGRVTYNYAHKYLAEFNIGINGSENFAPDKRFGKFPSYSIGWVPSEERFIKNNLKFLNFLKIRASYGKVGEDRSGSRFLYIPTTYKLVDVTWDSYYYRLFTTDNRTTSIPALREGNGYNPNVTWETSTKYNVGVDGKLFRSRLTFTLDFFKEERTGILTSLEGVPNYLYPTNLLGGFKENNYLSQVNYNEQGSKGYEMELGWADEIGKFSYSISGNYAFAQVINTKISETNVVYPWQKGVGLMDVGGGYGNISGYLADGLWDSYEEINDPRNPRIPGQKNPVPGDVRYKDVNGDGLITDLDIVPLNYGESKPLTSFGGNFSLGYKNLELSALIQGVTQVWYQNSYSWKIMSFEGDGPIFSWQMDDRWTPQTRGDKMNPVYHTGNTNSLNYLNSTQWFYDGTYIRLKNIRLAYTFPAAKLRKIMSGCQIYLSGQNIYTYYLDKRFRDGMDPERFEGYYPLMAIYSFGVNITF